MSSEARAFLEAGLPGAEMPIGARQRDLASQLHSQLCLWRSQSGHEFAAFVAKGEHFSSTMQTDIRLSKSIGIRPLVIATSYADVLGLAPVYSSLNPYVITEIAGKPALIPPLSGLGRRPQQSASPTRIPLDLLDRLRRPRHLPAHCVAALSRLREAYRRLKSRKTNNDGREEAALMRYATDILEGMGLRADHMSRTKMIRLLEGGGHGARRDHFFHSFQNYFLGLSALESFPQSFQEYALQANLHWSIDAHDVWFLTVMWHDVGYALQNAPQTAEWALGVELDETSEAALKRTYLEQASTQEAIQRISSLIARLTSPGRAKTAWMMPDLKTHLGVAGTKVRDAFVRNVIESHGAIGAIQLYRALKEDLDIVAETDKRETLFQSVLLAGASMPFHDYFFRQHMRECCGSCLISTKSLPFAALLAFIDSVQDDRRELVSPRDGAVILEQLTFSDPARVTALLNQRALKGRDVLPKILEARDVLAALDQTTDGLVFEYPQWMIRDS